MKKIKNRLSSSLLVMGRNCLEEVLKHKASSLLKVFVQASDTPEKRRDELIRLLEKKNISIRYLKKSELSSLLNSESHQGFAGLVKGRNSLSLSELIEKQKNQSASLLMILDSMQDPQNFGSILRSSECFGVDGIIWSKNRGTDITPVVTKASVGASELLSLVRVSNLVDAVLKLKKEGFWIVAVYARKGAENAFKFSFPERTVLIMGSENQGLQTSICRHADFHLQIPINGKISSLNVSQAAAIILSLYRTTYTVS